MRFASGIMSPNHVRPFFALICAAMAVTFSQGLMIPWMASVQGGHISPLMNGLSTSDTYAGLLVAMVFVRRLAQRMGLRSLLVGALTVGILTILAFALVRSAHGWLLLRFLFGMSLGAVHYGTQSWIGRLTTQEHRGKQMALYGLATGIGFALGPLFLPTGKLAAWLPFLLSAITFAISLVLVMRLSPAVEQKSTAPSVGFIRTGPIYKAALPALAFPLVFGFMESALNGDLPLFAQRVHMSLGVVSASLAAFVIGSLLFQFPLGYLSDHLSRKVVLLGCSVVGVVLFALLPSAAGRTALFVTLCFVVGAFVDTLFSFSLGYLADLVEPASLPVANQWAVTNLGVGLMVGSTVGGLTMTWFGPGGLFWTISLLYLLHVGLSVAWKPPFKATVLPQSTHQDM